ncbi:MAG TPA: hypothetical protein VF177_13585 [Anaerolineae bacterium]
MDHVIALGHSDIISERPFTHPSHTAADLSILRYMVDQLCLILEYPHMFADLPQPLWLQQPSAHRLVIIQPDRLKVLGQLTVVGFFGQKRPDADPSLTDEFDNILIAEFPGHPDLLSYSTLALDGGNFGNLVLFAHPEAKQQWSRSNAHAQAAGKLAPNYYASVRIYNGFLPDGVKESKTLQVSRVKYFDYQNSPLWQAVRTMH